MKMLVDTAKAANGVQFILITPQDMGVSRSSVSAPKEAPDIDAELLPRSRPRTAPKCASASSMILTGVSGSFYAPTPRSS